MTSPENHSWALGLPSDPHPCIQVNRKAFSEQLDRVMAIDMPTVYQC